MTPLTTTVDLDPVTTAVAQAFDVPFDGVSRFTPHELPPVPADYGIGVIVGGSGTGKTILLRSLGEIARPQWSAGRSIASHFATVDDAMHRLSAAGLNSIPDWVKPYNVLSTGQQFRADLARCLVDGARIDEFTSTVDRDTAKAASTALSRYVRRGGIKGIVLATCHRDILDWLEPDWVYDTDCSRLITDRRFLRPRIEVELVEGGRGLWPRFAPHHYLSGACNNSARVFTLWMGDRAVGFYAAVPMPGQLKGAWRGHRSVVLPEFQGLGLGGRMAEAVGGILLGEGRRFFCRTAHPWVGRHRDASPLWRATTTSRRQRVPWRGRPEGKPPWWSLDSRRICWSHEYLGREEERAATPATPPPAEPKLRVLTALRGDLGDRMVAEIVAGADVSALAKANGFRRSSFYRLLQWKGVDLKALKRARKTTNPEPQARGCLPAHWCGR